jgi:Asp-tRNA(Asn)/Glu-tRNA(Gln) amidotransferase A subunit family amidase
VSPLDTGPLSTVEGCAGALADGSVTAVDLVRRGIDRIERYDGPDGLNAVITVSPLALDEARAADERRRRGEARGPLDGVPFTVKDNIEAAGVRCTHGSSLFADWFPEQDAPVVARLRAAGMVMLAKVSLDDFAGASMGASSILGPMRNPYDPTRTVGGSSGGSAVAVAAGYAPLSLGTDTGGSLRIPAALCGVATMRPTNGVLPLDGIFPRSPSQDVVGPMALTAEGLAMSYAAMTGTPVPATPSAAPALAGLRVGVVEGGLAVNGDDPDGPVLRRFRELVAALRAHGVGIVPLEAPAPDDLGGASIIAMEARLAIDAYLARDTMPVHGFEELLATTGTMTEAVRIGLEYERVPAPDATALAERRGRRRALREKTHALMAEHALDAIMYPSVQRVPAGIGQVQTGAHTRWSEHTGMPVVALPMGVVDTGEGPCSADLLGFHGGDLRLLDVARAVDGVAATLRGAP